MTQHVMLDNRLQWPPGIVDSLREMWGGSMSASMIARALTRSGFPVSRNAVLGKAHRLGLPRRGPSGGRPSRYTAEGDAIIRDNWGKCSARGLVSMLADTGFRGKEGSVRRRAAMLGLPPLSEFVAGRERPPRPTKPTRPPVLVEPPPEPWDGPRINILDDNLKRHQCRFIVGGRGPTTMFCGAPTSPDDQFTFCAFHRPSLTRVSTGRTHSDATRERMRRAHLARVREAEAA